MPGRQASFGGVAALFGDDTADEGSANVTTGSAPAAKGRQASFGGVASLFGDDNEDDGFGTAPTATTTAATGRRAPSFGGVASLFGSDDDPPAAPISNKPSSSGTRSARQPSFGGVAALFGDDDEEAGPTVNTKPQRSGARQASFGGVAALFGDDEDEGHAAPINAAPPQKGSKKRDPSFSGVANLFGDDDDDEDEEEKSDQGPATPVDTLGQLQELPKTQTRSKKRDPSFGGVAGLFATDDNDEEEEDDENMSVFKPDLNKSAHDKETTDLQVAVEGHRNRAAEIEGELNVVKERNQDLENQIADLTKERQELYQSKLILIKNAAQEIQRMRDLMSELSANSTKSGPVKAATVA